MAEENNGGKGGEGGKPADEKIEVSKGDFEKLIKTIEQLKQENSDIVQELSAKKKELLDKAENEKKSKEAALAEQGKFKELAEQREAEIKSLRQTQQNLLIDMSLREAAAKEGLQDFDMLKLIDRADVKIDDNGKVAGIEEAVKNFKKSKPYLFGKAGKGGGFGVNNVDADRFDGVDPRNLTPDDIAKLSPEDRRKVIEILRPSNAPRQGSAFTAARERAAQKSK